MKIRKDIFGREPQIGDMLVFNPPKYKGLVSGICIGFKSASGLPIVGDLSQPVGAYDQDENGNRVYTPKTGFVIVFG